MVEENHHAHQETACELTASSPALLKEDEKVFQDQIPTNAPAPKL